MRIDERFDVVYGNKFDFNKMTVQADGVCFVGRSGARNGVSGRVALVGGVSPFASGLLTVALGGASRLATFVQPEPFYTAQNVAVLTPISPMTLEEKLYWAMCIRANRFRYEGFGREANRTLSSLDLPDTLPEWVENATVPPADEWSKPQAAYLPLTPASTWVDFRIDALFDVHKGRRLIKSKRSPGTTRFIGASEKNNGVTDYVAGVPQFKAGTITVSYNGSVGWAFYQDRPFLASDDVNVLIPLQPATKLALLFVAAVIRHGRTRFSYGYKWNLERMVASTIRLPVGTDGKPDWKYMDSYMQGLAFSDLAADDDARRGFGGVSP